jgi:hypothetical protein
MVDPDMRARSAAAEYFPASCLLERVPAIRRILASSSSRTLSSRLSPKAAGLTRHKLNFDERNCFVRLCLRHVHLALCLPKT